MKCYHLYYKTIIHSIPRSKNHHNKEAGLHDLDPQNHEDEQKMWF